MHQQMRMITVSKWNFCILPKYKVLLNANYMLQVLGAYVWWLLQDPGKLDLQLTIGILNFAFFASEIFS
jgi:hypothetical protein